MSTTFDVYPRTKQLPSFAAIIDRSTIELHRFLESVGVRARPPIHMRLQRCVDDTQVPFSLDNPARWAKDTYAWFTVGDVAGGTDAYFDDDAGKVQQLWDGQFSEPQCMRLEPLIRECVSTGHRWWFRRSVGQPATINVAYGLIAASLADITNGFLTSDDSAWDHQRMPALPDEFFSWYFHPERALSENFREWSQRCIGFLAEELGERPSRSGAHVEGETRYVVKIRGHNFIVNLGDEQGIARLHGFLSLVIVKAPDERAAGIVAEELVRQALLLQRLENTPDKPPTLLVERVSCCDEGDPRALTTDPDLIWVLEEGSEEHG